MSKLNFYAVYDKKAEAYNCPVVLASDAVALRSIRALLREPGSVFSQFPDDFALVKVAEFSQTTGDIVPLSVMVASTFAGLIEEKPAAPAN